MRSTLASLAVLKVNWENGRDYLDSLLPFCLECVRTSQSDVISLPDISEAIAKRFGLHLPQNITKALLRRAAKGTFVYPDHGTYRRNPRKPSNSAFEDAERRALGNIQEVNLALQQFALTRHSLTWTVEQCETYLLGFLADHDITVAFAAATQRPVDTQHAPSDKENYIIAAFIEESRQDAPATFQSIETILKGHILASAMVAFAPGGSSAYFASTTVFLDTSILIYALGYAGPQRQAPCVELLRLLREYRAELACFRITFDEIRGILGACSSRLRTRALHDSYGPSIEYFIEGRYSASDVDLLIARLEYDLQSIGVRVVDVPGTDDYRYVVDVQGFQDLLQSEIGYRNTQALIHDVDSITAIARLRKGHHSSAIERSVAVFVTDNWRLAK